VVEERDDRMPRATWFWLRVAAIVVSLFYGYQLLLVVRGWLDVVLDVAMLFVFGLVLSFLVQPFVDMLEREVGMPRSLAILGVLGTLLVLLAVLVYLLAGPLIAEASALRQELPTLVQGVQDRYAKLATDLGLESLGVNPRNLVSIGAGTVASNLLPWLIGGLQATVKTVVDIVVVLVVAFWLLKDGRRLRGEMLRALPAGVREHASFAFEAVAAVLGGYVRAQLLVALVIGALAGLGCYVLRVPFPIVVGLAAAVFELVPIVGPFVGGAVGVTLALTVSPLLALMTIGLFLLIHVIEGYVLAPRLQAQFTRIPTLVAFLAVFAGVEVGGFLGALFAVPVASLAFLFVRAALGDWRAERPDLFEQRGPVLRARHRRILAEFRPTWLRRLRRSLRRQRGTEAAR
jgi:predicted PurR-regulated permease PerM